MWAQALAPLSGVMVGWTLGLVMLQIGVGPVQSHGVWEVHGVIVIRLDPEKGLQGCIIKRGHDTKMSEPQ
ncbi:hypothetical protein M9458_056061, partial [Cirrhinus mrigala]